jgi:hypothetical protein
MKFIKIIFIILFISNKSSATETIKKDLSQVSINFYNYLYSKYYINLIVNESKDIEKLSNQICILNNLESIRYLYEYGINNESKQIISICERKFKELNYPQFLYSDAKFNEAYNFIKKLKFDDQFFKSTDNTIIQKNLSKQKKVDSINVNKFIKFINLNKWPSIIWNEPIKYDGKFDFLNNEINLQVFIIHLIYYDNSFSENCRKVLYESILKNDISFQEYINYQLSYLIYLPKCNNGYGTLQFIIDKTNCITIEENLLHIYVLCKYFASTKKLIRFNCKINIKPNQYKQFYSLMKYWGVDDIQIYNLYFHNVFNMGNCKNLYVSKQNLISIQYKEIEELTKSKMYDLE